MSDFCDVDKDKDENVDEVTVLKQTIEILKKDLENRNILLIFSKIKN